MQFGLVNNMQLSEFKKLSEYKATLTTMKSDKKLTSFAKEYFSLTPVILEKYKDILIRDFIDVDGTFAVVFPKDKTPSFLEGIGLYQDLSDILSYCMYNKVTNTGFISLDDHVGFWVLLDN
jgi:hypothetical protein